MKHILSSFIIILFSISVLAQQPAEKPVTLYGGFAKEKLLEAPFASWFNTGYNDYQPDSITMAALKKINAKGVSIQIFLGTWCGDSKREVPHFLKLTDQLGIPAANIQLIGLGRDSLLKQSPQHEEAGKGIFRVPVFIVYKNGVELNRINEYPAVSLEKDLYSILSNQIYQPNYRSFSTVNAWLADGVLKDVNASIRGLAGQVRGLVAGEHELNSLGYLLLQQSGVKEAVKLFQVNAVLYPESANVLSGLGEGLLRSGDIKSAIPILERSLELNRDPQLFREILKLLYEAREMKPE